MNVKTLFAFALKVWYTCCYQGNKYASIAQRKSKWFLPIRLGVRIPLEARYIEDEHDKVLIDRFDSVLLLRFRYNWSHQPAKSNDFQ